VRGSLNVSFAPKATELLRHDAMCHYPTFGGSSGAVIRRCPPHRTATQSASRAILSAKIVHTKSNKEPIVIVPTRVKKNNLPAMTDRLGSKGRVP
jgi:hypothetical protein